MNTSEPPPRDTARTDHPLRHPPGFRRRRGANWTFLGLMYGFFYMSRYNLSAISVGIGAQFGWTNAEYGKIVSAGLFTYGLSVFFNGPLADRVGGKRAILVGSVGAAAFNFLFGACAIFLSHPAVWNHGVVIKPAVLSHGMTATTLIATFATLWACNHYFQSFGALSIVKVNAAWFHVRERGVFAGIFGIMIQGGRTLAFFVSPLILAVLPWQYCFWIPAAILCVMFFANKKFVENTPADAGYEYDVADETAEEASQKTSLRFILRKVFASRATWLIACASMCIGMVRNSIDQWWARYFATVFHLPAAKLSEFPPYLIASFAMPAAAILGGLAAGTASDKLFGARRAPVIFFAFLGQALCLAALSQGLHSAWLGCLLLVGISFFIQSAHSLVGGAASMDFGGKKAVATAAGLFDGAQYLAGTIVGYGMGTLIDACKDARLPGVEYNVWPLAPIPFALLGAVLIARLWNVVPGQAQLPDAGMQEEQRMKRLSWVHRVQRVTLGAYALLAGTLSLIALILPQQLAAATLGHGLTPNALVMDQRYTGIRLGLALVALVAAFTPRPPRALVGAVMVGLLASIAGPLFSVVTAAVHPHAISGLRPWMGLDGLVAGVLAVTLLIRRNLRTPTPA